MTLKQVIEFAADGILENCEDCWQAHHIHDLLNFMAVWSDMIDYDIDSISIKPFPKEPS